METVTDFIFLGSKILADGDCGHEIKRHLLLGRKAMTNLDSILKSRHINENGPSSQSYGFPVVMYGCEIWTIKKAEHWRIDGFELWCWRRLLRVFWTARLSNQSEHSWEGLMLKHRYFGHLMGTADSLEKDSDAGKDWRQKKETEDEMVRWHRVTQWTRVWANSRSQ